MTRPLLVRKFTDQGVQRLQYDPELAPASGRMELRDAACPGLLLRMTPDGAKSFSVIYRVLGEGGLGARGQLRYGVQHRVTLGSPHLLGISEAREKAREIIRAATEGRNPKEEERDRWQNKDQNTFEKVLSRFLELEIKPSVDSWKNVEGVLRRHVLPVWADVPLQDIRRTHVHDLFDQLVEAGKAGAAREVRKHLSRLFNWAVDRELLTESPVTRIKRADLEQNDDAGRALTDLELRYIWAATKKLGYPFGPMFQLLILTGQRRGEWANSRRSEINEDTQCLELSKERFKGRREHLVPLPALCWNIVKALPDWGDTDHYLFSSRDGQVPVSGFSRAKARLDEELNQLLQKNVAQSLIPYRVHDFRVTCETRLASLGFNQDVRDAVLGHAKPGLQKIYNKHTYLDEKRGALEAYSRHVVEVAGDHG